jgi:hypothetical protein
MIFHYCGDDFEPKLAAIRESMPEPSRWEGPADGRLVTPKSNNIFPTWLNNFQPYQKAIMMPVYTWEKVYVMDRSIVFAAWKNLDTGIIFV